jgi:hypothetical protein
MWVRPMQAAEDTGAKASEGSRDGTVEAWGTAIIREPILPYLSATQPSKPQL